MINTKMLFSTRVEGIPPVPARPAPARSLLAGQAGAGGGGRQAGLPFRAWFFNCLTFFRNWVAMAGMVLLGMGGCTTASPVLTPDPSQKDQRASLDVPHQLRVSVRPVVTKGFRSEDREQFGIDLSAYFTAFYVEIQNGLSREVWMDAAQIFIEEADRPPLQALSESESVEYYRYGDQPRPVMILIPKRRKLEKQEIEKVRSLHFKSATLPPGSQHRGVVYFKKVSDQHCQGVWLRMDHIQVEGEDQPQQFRFRFNCGD